MKKELSPFLERFRIWDGHYGTKPGLMHGMFLIKGEMDDIAVMSSGVDRKYGWEHVSVSLANRDPTWGEMCSIKDAFWGDDEVVIQYHPTKDNYINLHPHCLHLWRPMRQKIPMPPTILVGPKP